MKKLSLLILCVTLVFSCGYSVKNDKDIFNPNQNHLKISFLVVDYYGYSKFDDYIKLINQHIAEYSLKYNLNHKNISIKQHSSNANIIELSYFNKNDLSNCKPLNDLFNYLIEKSIEFKVGNILTKFDYDLFPTIKSLQELKDGLTDTNLQRLVNENLHDTPLYDSLISCKIEIVSVMPGIKCIEPCFGKE